MRTGLNSWVYVLIALIPRAHFLYQLSDVAKGLAYLHSCNVIHGDLKGVRRHSDSTFATILTPASRMFLLILMVTHESQIFVSLQSLQTWIMS